MYSLNLGLNQFGAKPNIRFRCVLDHSYFNKLIDFFGVLIYIKYMKEAKKLNELAILSISFRPFFILAALIAIINPNLWVLSYHARISLPLLTVDPLFWHAHEMIFGFSSALIAGFILTASANWTNSEPYKNGYLLFLIIVWLLERGSYFFIKNIHLQYVLMNLFFPVLSILLLKKLWLFPKQRNVFLPIMLGFIIAKLMHSYGSIYSLDTLLTVGRDLAINLVRLIILLIAGRIIPFFTRKKIGANSLNIPTWVNPFAILPLVLLLIPIPESWPLYIKAFILLIAVVSNLYRQCMWRPMLTLGIPILFILHIGIALINIELLLELIGLFYDQIHFTQAALHLLMAGGLGVVGIGIMSRVSLGHTGRVIKADSWTCLAYVSVLIGSIIRAAIPIFYPEVYLKSLHYASGFWTLGFIIFLINYYKILIGRRPDGRPH